MLQIVLMWGHFEIRRASILWRPLRRRLSSRVFVRLAHGLELACWKEMGGTLVELAVLMLFQSSTGHGCLSRGRDWKTSDIRC